MYSNKFHIIVDKIATVVTTSLYIKFISGFKIIWQCLLEYSQENIFYYWSVKGVCDLMFDFLQGGLVWGISLKTFQLQLGYSVNLYVWRSVCIFHYFLKKYKNLWKLCRDLWRVSSWWSKCIKFISLLSLSPRDVLKYFLPIFVYCNFFYVPLLSWEPFSSFTSVFFYGWSWRYSEGYLIKETICQHLSLFLVETIFCIYLTVKVVRKIEEHIHVFSDMSSMRTGLQHAYCIVTTCQLVNLLWEPCFNPVLVQD